MCNETDSPTPQNQAEQTEKKSNWLTTIGKAVSRFATLLGFAMIFFLLLIAAGVGKSIWPVLLIVALFTVVGGFFCGLLATGYNLATKIPQKRKWIPISISI